MLSMYDKVAWNFTSANIPPNSDEEYLSSKVFAKIPHNLSTSNEYDLE